ncbi:hypothetical protein H0H93_011967 [Arthromyces matolae]|nr:hypothetical protein H0H93_011967 [Arthromyces matolae]
MPSAAAFATGCGVNVEMNHAYLDLRQNPVLARDYGKVAIEHCGMTFDHLGTSASTDFGNVTYEIPSLHPRYAIPCEPNGGNHTPLFTRAAQTKEAHIATMKVTKGLALTGFRVLSDSFFYEEVKAAFEVDKARAHSRPDNGASFEQ